MDPRVTLVTPTYAGDYERFRFLRESMARCDIDIDHVAIVNPEDLDLFGKIPHARRLTVVGAEEVLPADILVRVRRGSRRLGRTPAALTKRALQAMPGWRWSMSGWFVQQLLKLGADAVVGTDDWVCIDSDCFFLERSDLAGVRAPDGRLVLHEPHTQRELHPRLRARSARLLGIEVTEPRRHYIGIAVPISGAVVADMRAHIEARTGLRWTDAMHRAKATEYTTYGFYARYVDRLERVVAADLKIATHVYDADMSRLPEHLAAGRTQGRPIAMVHSGLGMRPADYRHVVEPMWASPRG